VAQRTLIMLIDDTDGTEDANTISFGLDGKLYEIDLTEPNARALRDLLAPYIAAGRRVTSKTKRTPAASTGLNRDQAAAIRAWAKLQGLKVSGSGRIPAHVIDQYKAAQSPTAHPARATMAAFSAQ